MGAGRAPWLPSMLFSFIRMPASLTSTLTLAGIGTESFRVTGKGRAGEVRRRMRAPGVLVVLLALSGLAAVWYVGTVVGLAPFHYRIPWVAHAAAVCLLVNAALMSAAVYRIQSSRFSSDRRAAVRFAVHGRATVGSTELAVHDVSLTGARLLSAAAIERGAPVVLDLAPMLREPLAAVVRSCRPGPNGYFVGVEFNAMPTMLRAHLALDLFQTGLTPSLRTEPVFAEPALSPVGVQ
jgi:PilZ domain